MRHTKFVISCIFKTSKSFLYCTGHLGSKCCPGLVAWRLPNLWKCCKRIRLKIGSFYTSWTQTQRQITDKMVNSSLWGAFWRSLVCCLSERKCKFSPKLQWRRCGDIEDSVSLGCWVSSCPHCVRRAAELHQPTTTLLRNLKKIGPGSSRVKNTPRWKCVW